MKPKSRIVDLPVYQPGKPMEEVKRELGLSKVVKLASNENPFGCSPKAKEAIMATLDTTHIYPDGGAVALTKAVSESLGVETNQIIFGAGSDEVILMLCRAYLQPGDETVMASHTFPQYKHNAVIEVRMNCILQTKPGLSARLCIGSVWSTCITETGCNPVNRKQYFSQQFRVVLFFVSDFTKFHQQLHLQIAEWIDIWIPKPDRFLNHRHIIQYFFLSGNF